MLLLERAPPAARALRGPTKPRFAICGKGGRAQGSPADDPDTSFLALAMYVPYAEEVGA